MKQLGNLALVCAKRPEILFQILNGKVAVYIGHGPNKTILSANWDDDNRIRDIIRELNSTNLEAFPATESENRCFRIETPLGLLKVSAKYESDSPDDYPGVYVDLERGSEEILLACVEFDSLKKRLLTCVFGDGREDEPTDVVTHRNID